MMVFRIGCSDMLLALKNSGTLLDVKTAFAVNQKRINAFHLTGVRRYPETPVLPLPINVSEIFANETGRFTPERSRDIAAPTFLYSANGNGRCTNLQQTQHQNFTRVQDSHVDSYDCFGAVSLNGTMQSNVPTPFCSKGKSMHLNMPGGQWARDGKYIAEDMQKSHYRTYVFDKKASRIFFNKNGSAATNIILKKLQLFYDPKLQLCLMYSTSSEPQAAEIKQLKRERLKQLLKECGAIAAIFHVTISLISLGTIYAALSFGVELDSILDKFISSEDVKKFTSNTSTFLLAYGIHKCLAGPRIAVTLATVPLLVRFLRHKGLIKPMPVLKKNPASSGSSTKT
ncbi:uncharacterized protein [Prorops nasuta]|uniref:uncharacterized protein n=1 Tax=Prorops nasuta TaxID=863751 RepID=UPI0034CFF379